MENVTKWLMKVSNSKATVSNYEYRIRKFASYMKEHFNIDIETLKDAYREAKYKGEIEREKFLDRLHDAIEDYVCFFKTQGYTNMHVKVMVSIISSYIKKGCGIRDIDIDIPKRPFPIYHNRDITKEEIRKILEHCSLRDRAFFLMMVESGLRPSTLLGLRYKHIKQDFERNIIPMKIELPSELLKDRISARWSFIGEDGFKVLKEYLSARKDIGDNDFLFLPEKPSRVKAEVPSESAMSNKFNRIVLKLGLDTPLHKGKPKSLRLYSLRKYFFNNMKCDSAYRNYWFCHKSIDDHYISQDVQKHREEYAKGYKFLRIYEPSDIDVRIEALTRELKEKHQRIQELEEKFERLQPLIDFVNEFFNETTLSQFLNDIKNVDVLSVEKKNGEGISFMNLSRQTVKLLAEFMKRHNISDPDEALNTLFRMVIESKKQQQP